jgi:predicted dehydrogenase
MNISRRTFLAGAAGTVAAPTIVPSSVFGHDAPSNRVNLAAIGVGNRGFGNCIHNFQPLKGVQFLAVADCFADRRTKFANKVNEKVGKNICKPYLDYNEALERDDIDAVVISTPDHWHALAGYHAAEAGKHMYIEKPLSVAFSWAQSLRESIRRNNVVFQYGTQQRSNKFCQTAVDLVRNGYVGEIEHVDVWCPSLATNGWGQMREASVPDQLDYDRWIGPASMAPYTPDRVRRKGSWHIYDYALGFIAGWGAHPLDILQWGLDRDDTAPIKFNGKGKLPPENTLSDTLCQWDVAMEYADGVSVRFMSGDIAKPVVKDYHPAWQYNGTTFHGRDGWVSASRGGAYMKRDGTMINISNVEFKSTDKRAYSGASHAQNFIDAVRGEAKAVNPIESAINSDVISHLSDISIRAGQPVEWDPDIEQLVNGGTTDRRLSRHMRNPWTLPRG